MFKFRKPKYNILTVKINTMIGLLVICFIGVAAALYILVEMNNSIKYLQELNEGAASQGPVINRKL